MLSKVIKSMLKKIMNACGCSGCVDIKVIIFLFFILAIIYSMYSNQINSMIKGEDCGCDK